MKRIWVIVVAALWTVGTAQAQDVKRLADHLGALNHITCYPFGLDMIGAGNTQAGIDAWKQCFTPDFMFRCCAPANASENRARSRQGEDQGQVV
jgi:hypothetical protein